MKMVLWVEDEEASINLVFPDEKPTDKSLLDDYHIHRCHDLYEAVSAINERDYDCYLLDINLPIHRSRSPHLDLTGMPKAGVDTSPVDNLVKRYGGEGEYNLMDGGQFLFKHLRNKDVKVSQIRIFSGHIGEATSFKEYYQNLTELRFYPWSEIVFSKDGDNSSVSVRKWLDKNTIENRAGILRHAMIEGCVEILANERDRPIYLRPSSDGVCEQVDAVKIHNDVKLLRDIVSITSHADPNKSHQVYLLLMTKDCQEQLSFLNKKNTEKNPEITLKEDFKRIATVLDRVRNMLAHNTTLNKDGDLTSFVAFVFLLYVRYLNSLSDESSPFERNLLHLICNPECEPRNLSESHEILKQIISDRCHEIGKKDDLRRHYWYEQLLREEVFFDKPYGIRECMALFLFKFWDYDKNGKGYVGKVPTAVLKGEQLEVKSGHVKSASIEFTEGLWYHDYLKVFASEVCFKK